MAMWEIDELLKESIKIIHNANIDMHLQKNLIWNLENIPEQYQFDAGNFPVTENDTDFNYESINPYDLGLCVCNEAEKQSEINLIYNWSAFLLNFWNEYFADSTNLEDLKRNSLLKLKEKFQSHTFENYQPIHVTLTMYIEGSKWFTDEQNELIKWFYS